MRRPVVSLVTCHRPTDRPGRAGLGSHPRSERREHASDAARVEARLEALVRDFPQASSSPALIAMWYVRVTERAGGNRGIARAARPRRRVWPQRPAGRAGRELRRDRRLRSRRQDGKAGAQRGAAPCRTARSRARFGARALVWSSEATPPTTSTSSTRWNSWLPIVFAYVLGLNFVLLTSSSARSWSRPPRSFSTCSRSARRPRGARLPHGRFRPARFPARRRDRGLGAALPVLGPLRPSRWTTRSSCSAGLRSATTRLAERGRHMVPRRPRA